ncbi:MAG: ribosome-associated translation inhibitor RaiA [Caulobacteraceae bacterium]
MHIQVSGRHIAVGDALRSRIEDELVARIGKYFERNGGSAEVVVSKDGHTFCVDIVAVLVSGQQLVTRGNGADAHAAFDAALTKIEARVRRYKRRLTNHHPHNGARSPDEMASYVVLKSLDDDDDADWASDHHAGAPAAMVIAETEARVKTMTVSMAVMDLDLTEAPALVFRNAAHGGLSVVYRRADGNIGWIDPERTRASAPAAAE